MTSRIEIPLTTWTESIPGALATQAVDELESGNVLFFPQLPFRVEAAEQGLLSPAIIEGSKNVSYDAKRDQLGGTALTGADYEILRGMMRRFARDADQLVRRLLPEYAEALVQGRTSFRPAEIDGRPSSWRKDDTRLHVDAFPATPVHGMRILRLFSNVNPAGKPRKWRLGEPFPQVARRFVSGIPRQAPGKATLMQLLHITKSRRTDYDHYMLHLHDAMKADSAYQRDVEQGLHDFSPNTTWMVYTDQVSHAVMSGQHLMEQTFYLPVAAMKSPATSPLRVLEGMLGRALV